MEFSKDTPLYGYETKKEGGEDVLYINYMGAPYVPRLEDSEEVMSRTMDNLMENPNVSRIVFVQQKNYNYDNEETMMLLEVAQLYIYLIKQERVLSQRRLMTSDQREFSRRYNEVFSFLFLLKKDPVAGYVDLKNKIIEEKVRLDSLQGRMRSEEIGFINLLERVLDYLEDLKLIKKAKPYLKGYFKGDRDIYSNLFRADVIPNFTFTRLVSDMPNDAEIMDQYEISNNEYDKSVVTILKRKNRSKLIYHISPPENTLGEEENILLKLGKNVLIQHQPKAEEMTDTERTRNTFFNIAKDLLSDLSENKGINISYSDLNKLATILVRNTIGFGLIEVLLQDTNLQDISLNSPIPQVNIFVKHNKYDECSTNILPSQEDANSWAAKFRMMSGRPLDEANPILDTQLEIGNLRARISIVQNPLSPDGLAYSIRRHREDPWTFSLFLENKMINPLAAGLLSFLIDGSRTLLVAGTRSSGKTSLLGSMLLEIVPKYRIITVEDSVTRDTEIIVKEDKKFKKTTIGELINKKIEEKGYLDKDGREKCLNLDNTEIFSVNKEGKTVLTKPSKFIRHKTNKQIYEIETSSGKKIKITGDHSLFSLSEKEIIKPVKCKDLKKGDFISVPSKLDFDNKLRKIDLLDYLDRLDKKTFVLGKNIENYIHKNKKKIFEKGYFLKYSKLSIQNWINKGILPFSVFLKLRNKINKKGLYIKYANSKKISSELILDKDFLNFIGLWLADGCYDRKSVIVSVQEEENREIVRRVGKKLGIPVKRHKDGFSLMLNSSLLKEIMENILELKGNSYTKKIPEWVYNLSDKQVGELLKGFFSGDGCVSKNEVLFSICSKELAEDIMVLLLRLGIVSRGSYRLSSSSYLKNKIKMFNWRIGDTEMIKKFRKNIGFLVNSKQKKLDRLCSRVSTHDSSDVIPLEVETKKRLSKILGNKFNKNDYIERNNNVGRKHLSKLINSQEKKSTKELENLKKIIDSDIFWDKVKNIKKVNYKGFVYDISVPGCENFVCNNVLAHNTLELPVESMRDLKFNILRLKVRSALLKGSSETSAAEGIRSSLRLGDSCLIIGEVRSEEAKALYEAMRVGALANVVAGTIHGASPYGVFDRVVNDLGVPATSFKATDIVVVCNPVKSADGLHFWRRVVRISEVRKHWSEDPISEGGFVDLMKYNVETDELEPTEELINGDSEIVKEIAGNVKGWAGNWDAVWDNIELRGKIKEELMKKAKETGKNEIMESEFSVLANHSFHRISDEVIEEHGLPWSDKVFPKWKEWLDKEVERRFLS